MSERPQMTTEDVRRAVLNYRYVKSLAMNGGRQPLGPFRREEFSAYENAGLIAYRADGIVPYLELTPAGWALAQAPVTV